MLRFHWWPYGPVSLYRQGYVLHVRVAPKTFTRPSYNKYEPNPQGHYVMLLFITVVRAITRDRSNLLKT